MVGLDPVATQVKMQDTPARDSKFIDDDQWITSSEQLELLISRWCSQLFAGNG